MKLFCVVLCVFVAVYLAEGKSVVDEKPKAAPAPVKAVPKAEPKIEAKVEAKVEAKEEEKDEEVSPEKTKTSSYGNSDLDEDFSDEDDEDEKDSDNLDEDEDEDDENENALNRSNVPKKDLVAHVDYHHNHGHEEQYSHGYDSGYHHGFLHYHRQRRTLYHMYMTPTWLKAHASFIDTTSDINNDQLRFITYTNRNDARLIKIDLLGAGEIKDDEPITVEIVVAMSKTIGTYRDSDIRYMITDGNDDCFGVETCNVADYRVYKPCYGVEGKSGSSLSKMVWVNRKKGRYPQNRYPAEFTFRFKTQERWGSCSADVPGGFTNTFHFSRKLKQSKGLKLEVYKQGKHEQVAIKYITVTIKREG